VLAWYSWAMFSRQAKASEREKGGRSSEQLRNFKIQNPNFRENSNSKLQGRPGLPLVGIEGGSINAANARLPLCEDGTRRFSAGSGLWQVQPFQPFLYGGTARFQGLNHRMGGRFRPRSGWLPCKHEVPGRSHHGAASTMNKKPPRLPVAALRNRLN